MTNPNPSQDRVEEVARAILEADTTEMIWQDGFPERDATKLAIAAINAMGESESVTVTRDKALELAARIAEGSTSWGLSPTKLEAVQSFQKFAAKAIRAQKSDSPEHLAKLSHGSVGQYEKR